MRHISVGRSGRNGRTYDACETGRRSPFKDYKGLKGYLREEAEKGEPIKLRYARGLTTKEINGLENAVMT